MCVYVRLATRSALLARATECYNRVILEESLRLREIRKSTTHYCSSAKH